MLVGHPSCCSLDTIVRPPPSHARCLPPLSSTAADSGTSRYACHHKRGTAWTLHFVSPRALFAPARLIIFEMLCMEEVSQIRRNLASVTPIVGLYGNCSFEQNQLTHWRAAGHHTLPRGRYSRHQEACKNKCWPPSVVSGGSPVDLCIESNALGVAQDWE